MGSSLGKGEGFALISCDKLLFSCNMGVCHVQQSHLYSWQRGRAPGSCGVHCTTHLLRAVKGGLAVIAPTVPFLFLFSLFSFPILHHFDVYLLYSSVSAVMLRVCLFFTPAPQLRIFFVRCSQIYTIARDVVHYLFSPVCG